MDASGSLARAFSSAFLACNSTPQPANDAAVFLVCARAGVSPIGVTSDRVLFQPVVETLSLPLSAFADPERAIALIKAKLVEVGR
jgi:hypothetical protein